MKDIHGRAFDFACSLVRLHRMTTTSKVAAPLLSELLRFGLSIGSILEEAESIHDKADFIAQGLDLAVEMWAVADVVYFNAVKQIGCFVEIHGDNADIRDVFRRWKTAHDTWDGETDPLR